MRNRIKELTSVNESQSTRNIKIFDVRVSCFRRKLKVPTEEDGGGKDRAAQVLFFYLILIYLIIIFIKATDICAWL